MNEEVCDICERTPAQKSATLTDESGGAFVIACLVCVDELREGAERYDGCACCGDAEPDSKSGGLHTSDPDEFFDICDRCRIRIIQPGSRPEVRR